MSASRAEITRRLFEFYDRAGRDLPWRHTTDPYAIWVSEVMLQQTRVETVLPYFTAWMTRFPTVDSVANADLEDVLTVWTGLGYYSRARSLHRAARTVRDEFGGRLPEDARRLQSLPGIGAYTAGAIASIAYGAPVPAVDGNVLRVIARLFDLPVATPTTVRPYVLSLLDAGRPGDLNQSIMDLGATVCTPSAPKCDECPLREDCLARAHQTVEHRPAKRSRRPLRTRCFAAAV